MLNSRLLCMLDPMASAPEGVRPRIRHRTLRRFPERPRLTPEGPRLITEQPRTLDGPRIAGIPGFPTSSFIGFIGFIAFIVLAWPNDAAAQEQPADDVPVVTKTMAIRNVRIVVSPEEVIERGTVVMRNGLITDVAVDAAVPYDAEIIEGDSLVVYPGFIDGLSHAGIPESDAERRPDGVNTADPPPEVAGIKPNVAAYDLLDAAHASIGALRRLGFTVSHVVPRGRMLPGSGSLVLLSGDRPSDMVLRPGVSLFLQFTGGPGVYPATTMGVMAHLRQLFRETERGRRIADLYADDPAGIERPTFNPIHEALAPVLRGDRPLFVAAGGAGAALAMRRALQLQSELGFSLALAGIDQAFEMLDALREADVPLFLTLDLPEVADSVAADSSRIADPGDAEGPDGATDRAADADRAGDGDRADDGDRAARAHRAADADAAADPDAAADADRAADADEGTAASAGLSAHDPDLRTRTFADVDREKENLAARRRIARRRYVETARMLHDAGVTFGFSSRSADLEDIRKNLLEMIKAGLPESAALAALTIDGAQLLGIDRTTGTIEPGKLANLVVTRGSYFDGDNDPVRFVFVEGRKYAYEEEDGEADAQAETASGAAGDPGGKAPDEDAPDEVPAPSDVERADLSGTWELTIRTSDGTSRAQLRLTVVDNLISGRIDSSDLTSPADLVDTVYDAGRLTFALDTPEYGRITARLDVRGDTMAGTVDVPGVGVLETTGSKVPRN